MKIGFSYSRCVLDLFCGEVDYDDVLVIITRTNFNPTNEEHWESIWRGYTVPNGYSDHCWWAFADKEKEFRDLTLKLWYDGKLHQPRTFGHHPRRVGLIWQEVVRPEQVATEDELRARWTSKQ